MRKFLSVLFLASTLLLSSGCADLTEFLNGVKGVVHSAQDEIKNQVTVIVTEKFGIVTDELREWIRAEILKLLTQIPGFKVK